MTPTPELLTEVFLNYGAMPGHKILMGQGYDISQRQCRAFRRKMRAEGNVVLNHETWTPDRVERVRAMAAEGHSSKTIASALGVTQNSIHHICRSRRFKLKKGPTIPTPPREQVEAAVAGTSIVKAAAVFGVSDRTFKRWLRQYSINLRAREAERKIAAPEPVPAITLVKPMRNACYRPADLPPPETGPAADAARYLRYVGYANVYRRGPEEWWVGRGLMSEADMIARAEEVRQRKERLRA